MLDRYSQRGDTIIEVLLAVGIFSLVAIGGMAIMNQGTNTAQRAVEITLVRQQIDAQAEALRAIHQAASRKNKAAIDAWNSITENAPTDNTSAYTGDACPTDPGGISPIPTTAFALNPDTAERLTGSWYLSSTPATAPPYAQYIEDKSAGIWIEPTREGGADDTIPTLYSFKVNACWPGAGTDVPMRLSTIVNLYDIGFGE